MSDIKKQVINLDVYHFEAKLNGDMSFTITFWGKREKGKDKNRLEVNMKMKLYWLKQFKDQFQKVAKNALNRVTDTGFLD